jgi:transcriptional regulator of acetoin/glycerol metabolism
MAQPAEGSADSLQSLEYQAIKAALQKHEGNVSAAARSLGVARNTIYRKIAIHNQLTKASACQ